MPWRMAAAAVLAMGSRLRTPGFLPRIRGWRIPLMDGVVLALLGGSSLDAGLRYDWYHYNFYLGPTAQVLAGGTPLADATGQYGPGPAVFLALLIKTGLMTPTFRGMSFMLCVLLALQAAAWYVIARSLIRPRAAAVAAVSAIALVACGGRVANMFPSNGPLRFGPGLLLVMVASLRGRYGLPGLRWAERVLIGVAAVWSAESFAYALAAALGVAATESGAEPDRRKRLRALGRHGAAISLAVATAWTSAAIIIRARSGAWPDLPTYAEYLLLYGRGYAGLLADPWDPWSIVLGTYTASALALARLVLGGWAPRERGRLAAVGGLTALGVAQFTYYLGRAHPVSLNVAAAPAILLGVYWLAWAAARPRPFPRRLADTFRYTAWFVLLFLLAASFPGAAGTHGAAGPAGAIRTVLGRARALVSDDPRAEEAAALVRRHAGAVPRVAAFLGPRYTTEVLLLTGRGHVFPVGMFDQDGLIPSARDKALRFSHGLRPGDIIFVWRRPYWITDGERGYALQRDLLRRLGREFRFHEVEGTAEGFAAVRLLAPEVPRREEGR